MPWIIIKRRVRILDLNVQIATCFFKEMGQEFEMPHELLLTAEKI